MRGIYKKGPQNGDKKIIKKFAFFPVIINLEWRWLEYVEYEQEFNKDYVNYDSFDCDCWFNKRFLT